MQEIKILISEQLRDTFHNLSVPAEVCDND